MHDLGGPSGAKSKGLNSSRHRQFFVLRRARHVRRLNDLFTAFYPTTACRQVLWRRASHVRRTYFSVLFCYAADRPPPHRSNALTAVLHRLLMLLR